MTFNLTYDLVSRNWCISPIFFEIGIPDLVCKCILGSLSVTNHFWVTVPLTSDLVFKNYCVQSISPILFNVGIPNLGGGGVIHLWMVEWCIPFWVTLTLTLTSGLISRIVVLYYSFLSSNVSYARPIPLGAFVTCLWHFLNDVSYSFLQVTRTTIKAWMSLNIIKIPSLTTELAALEHLIRLVTTLAPLFLIGSSSLLQVTRTTIKSWMSLKYCQTRPPAAELAPLECQEKIPYSYYGRNVVITLVPLFFN